MIRDYLVVAFIYIQAFSCDVQRYLPVVKEFGVNDHVSPSIIKNPKIIGTHLNLFPIQFGF